MDSSYQAKMSQSTFQPELLVPEACHLDELVPFMFTTLPGSLLLDDDLDIARIVFPEKTVMWPIFSATGEEKFYRQRAVLSSHRMSYGLDRVWVVNNDHRGFWFFVRHLKNNVVGFITTATQAEIEEYGNSTPVSLHHWLSKQRIHL